MTTDLRIPDSAESFGYEWEDEGIQFTARLYEIPSTLSNVSVGGVPGTDGNTGGWRAILCGAAGEVVFTGEVQYRVGERGYAWWVNKGGFTLSLAKSATEGSEETSGEAVANAVQSVKNCLDSVAPNHVRRAKAGASLKEAFSAMVSPAELATCRR